jgi:hypothetical protein
MLLTLLASCSVPVAPAWKYGSSLDTPDLVINRAAWIMSDNVVSFTTTDFLGKPLEVNAPLRLVVTHVRGQARVQLDLADINGTTMISCREGGRTRCNLTVQFDDLPPQKIQVCHAPGGGVNGSVAFDAPMMVIESLSRSHKMSVSTELDVVDAPASVVAVFRFSVSGLKFDARGSDHICDDVWGDFP